MKKLLSIILVLAIAAAMLPSVFAAEGELKFVFDAACYENSTDPIIMSTLEGYATNDTNATKNTEPWRIEGVTYTDKRIRVTGENKFLSSGDVDNASATINNIARPHSLSWRHNKDKAWNASGAQRNAAVALLINIRENGTFVPLFSYEGRPDGCIYDVYLVPETVVTSDNTGKLIGYQTSTNTVSFANGASPYLTQYMESSGFDKDKYYIGSLDMYAADSDSGAKSSPFEGIKLESSGNYYLLFQSNGVNSAIQSTYSGNVCANLYSFTLTPVESEEPSVIEKAFDYTESNHTGTGRASITAYAVYGADGEVVDTQTIENMPGVTYGEVCESITAPEAPSGYKFLYWAKGMTMGKKQVVSYSETIPEYRPHEGVNYLIAVYEEVGGDADTVEFYNANGQLLDLTLTAESKLPPLPSMAGYGKAVKWALRNEDGTYTEYEEGADISELSGTLVFMAKYEDLKKEIKVTVNGGEPTYYAYGDPVPCTTDAENFSYWTKTVNGNTEIVSTKKEYTFKAYEECTVTAVCNGAVDLGKTMRKIILSTFAAGDETAIMAEFIGFEDALEKGIMFGNQKIAMNTDKTQFTVINDAKSATTVTGYAIVNDGSTIKKLTDAEITVGAN